MTKSLPLKTQQAVEFIKEKGASSWLSVIPLKEMNFTLNKREFRDAIKLRYGWEFNDNPTVCVCGDLFDADHAMICMRRGYIILWFLPLLEQCLANVNVTTVVSLSYWQ